LAVPASSPSPARSVGESGQGVAQGRRVSTQTWAQKIVVENQPSAFVQKGYSHRSPAFVKQ
jgi:hypothetical protein